MLLPAVLLTLAGGMDETQHAWWLTLAPEAMHTTYRGRPLAEWHPSLAAVSPLQCNHQASIPDAQPCTEMRENGATFQLRGDFDGDGRSDLAEVLAGRLHDGTEVAVLALAPVDAPDQGRVWLVQDELITFLYPTSLGIGWYMCMICDNGWEVRWDGHYDDYIVLDLAPRDTDI